MTALTPIRVAALTSGRNVPSSRFRVRQHIPFLDALGVKVTEYAPVPDKYVSVGAVGKVPRFMKPAVGAIFRALTLAARGPGIRASGSVDVTWLERELVPGIYSAEGRLGSPFVFDVDDAIWAHRDAHVDQLRRIAREASVVVAGNEFIAEWFRPHARRIEVIPTAVDAARFTPAAKRDRNPRLRVGWIGTNSNFAYLESIEPVLARFLESSDAELVIVCDRAPRLKIVSPKRVVFAPWAADSEVELIRSFDVGLMPLFDDEWGRGKCGFKALQYMACGVPAIVSPVGFNRRLVATGGAVEAEGETGWLAALRSLAASADTRASVGLAGRAAVEREYSCDVVSARIARVLIEAARAGRDVNRSGEHD